MDNKVFSRANLPPFNEVLPYMQNEFTMVLNLIINTYIT